MEHKNISMKEYVADKILPIPTISASNILTILEKSAFHAAALHPRAKEILGRDVPAQDDDSTRVSSIGEAAHAILMNLETERIAVSPFPDFRSGEARAWKEAQVKADKIILKEDDYNAAREMAQTLCRSLARFYPELQAAGIGPFPEKGFEKTYTAQLRGIMCRIRVDAEEGGVIWDYKTTGADFQPEKWLKNQYFGMGYDIKAAFYARVFEAATGIAPKFVIAAQENSFPFDAYPVMLTPEALERANEMIDYALEEWQRGISRGFKDGGYSARVVYASPPPWLVAAWEEKKMREEFAREQAA